MTSRKAVEIAAIVDRDMDIVWALLLLDERAQGASSRRLGQRDFGIGRTAQPAFERMR